MLRAFEYAFLYLFFFATVCSLVFYNGYNHSSNRTPVRFAGFLPEKMQIVEVSGIIERIIAEKLNNELDENNPYILYRDFGTQLNKEDLKDYSRSEWDIALVRLEKSFPNRDMHQLFTVIDCYANYLVYQKKLAPSRTELSDASQLFENRRQFFGFKATRELFYSEWMLTSYSPEDSNAGGRTADSDKNVVHCRLALNL